MPPKKDTSLSNTDAFQKLTLEEAIRELVTAQKTIKELQEIRNLTHLFFQIVCNYDINTPLQAILGFSELILEEIDGSLNEQMRDDLTRINKNAREIQHVINTALATLQAERVKIGTQQELPPVEVSLGQILEDTRLAEKANVQINIDKESVPNVSGDPYRLLMAIVETASALSKNFTEGRIVLDIDRSEDWLTIRISNSELILSDQILEKFSQVASAPTLFASEYVSEALTLSISRFFIERYGGAMSLNSNGEIGSVVRVTLPVYKGKT